jgi:hypothetical protein
MELQGSYSPQTGLPKKIQIQVKIQTITKRP